MSLVAGLSLACAGPADTPRERTNIETSARPSVVVTAPMTTTAPSATTSADAPPAPSASSAPAPACARTVVPATKATRCTKDTECIIQPSAGCCWPCGQLDLENARAIHVSDFAACHTTCPACASMPSSTLQAECVNQACALVETLCTPAAAPVCPRVRPPAILAGSSGGSCTSDGDCTLALKNCCHCGVATSEDVVPQRKDKPRVCSGSCPDCLFEGVDPSLVPACVAGRCRARDLGLDTNCIGALR